MKERTTYPNVNRSPRKYPKKSLHGRVRAVIVSYKELRRFQEFYVNVFGWDMIETPEAASGIPSGDSHPSLLIASGPAQYDYEAATLGHMTVWGVFAPGETVQIPALFTEISMDDPLEETVREMLDHGGRLVLDRNEAVQARPLDDSRQYWWPQAVIEDPCGNHLCLWKCPSSRTWNELETEYDRE